MLSRTTSAPPLCTGSLRIGGLRKPAHQLTSQNRTYHHNHFLGHFHSYHMQVILRLPYLHLRCLPMFLHLHVFSSVLCFSALLQPLPSLQPRPGAQGHGASRRHRSSQAAPAVPGPGRSGAPTYDPAAFGFDENDLVVPAAELDDSDSFLKLLPWSSPGAVASAFDGLQSTANRVTLFWSAPG